MSVLSLKQVNKLAWHLKIRDHVPVLIMILSIPDSAPNISPEPQGSVWHLHLHSRFLWQWMFDSLDQILQMHLSQNLSTIHIFLIYKYSIWHWIFTWQFPFFPFTVLRLYITKLSLFHLLTHNSPCTLIRVWWLNYYSK